MNILFFQYFMKIIIDPSQTKIKKKIYKIQKSLDLLKKILYFEKIFAFCRNFVILKKFPK